MELFVGRQRELDKLASLQKKKSSSLVVIRGRRRVGKSRLVREFAKKQKFYEFAGLPPTEDVTDLEQRTEFARQLSRELGIPIPRADDWGDLFWHLATHTKTGRVIILLDEITWMGHLDPTFLGKLKNTWDIYFKKNDKLILIICGSVSSWIEDNILSSTGFLGRISLNMLLPPLDLKSCIQFWGQQQSLVSPLEQLKVLSVAGGIPRYLEEVIPERSAEDNIHSMCFEPDGILVNEFNQIFSDLFLKRSEVYRKLVVRLADGAASLDDLCKSISKEKGGVVSGYLNELTQAGFVSRDATWNLHTTRPSSLVRFRLEDNYLRFYLKYIEPRLDRIQLGLLQNQSLGTLPGWDTIMGLQIENLVISNRQLLYPLLRIDPSEIVTDGPFFQRQTQRQAGCQIDYLIQTRLNALYVCEIKVSRKSIGPKVIHEVNEKIKRLTAPKHFSIRPVLIHAGELSNEIEERGFFSHIIDFSSLLR